MLDSLDIYMVETMDEVLKIALAGPLGTVARRPGGANRRSYSTTVSHFYRAGMREAARGILEGTGAPLLARKADGFRIWNPAFDLLAHAASSESRGEFL